MGDINLPPGFSLVSPSDAGNGDGGGAGAPSIALPPGFTLVQPNPTPDDGATGGYQMLGQSQGIRPEDARNFGEGVVSGAVGVPGDLEHSAMWLANKLGLANPTDTQETFFPTSQKVGETLFGPPSDQGASEMQQAGNIIGGLAGPAALSKGAGAAGSVAKELLPSAASRSMSKLAEVGAPGTTSELGATIQSKLDQRLSELQQTRTQATQQLRQQAFASSPQTAPVVAGKFRQFLSDLYLDKFDDLSPAQRSFIEQSEARLQGNPSIEALDTERRFLNDVAEGKVEGFDAIKANFAGNMAKQLTQIMRENVPGYDQYLNTYAQQSEPINLYHSLLGQRATNTVDDFSTLTKFDPSGLPNTVFKSKQSIDTFRQMVNDDNFVSQVARQHAANQLETQIYDKNIRSAAHSVKVWLHDNRDWLNEVPDVQQDAQNFADTLSKTANTQTGAKVVVGAGAALYFMNHYPISSLRSLLGGL